MHAQKRPERTLNFSTELISEGHSLMINSVSKHWEKWPKFLQKFTRHTKKQENMAHSKKQNKPPESITEETQTSDLLTKAFKTTIFNMMKELKENTKINKF